MLAITESAMGLPCPLIAWQFDSAVVWFGNFVEAKLAEYDPKTHKLRYAPEQILRSKQENTAASLALAEKLGIVENRG